MECKKCFKEFTRSNLKSPLLDKFELKGYCSNKCEHSHHNEINIKKTKSFFKDDKNWKIYKKGSQKDKMI